MMNDFIQWAKKELGNVTGVEKEPHGDQSEVYRLHTPQGIFFLKVGKDLSKEKERLEWLRGKLSVPKVVGFTARRGTDALLLFGIEGTNLAQLSKEWPPKKVVRELVAVLRAFHTVSIEGCPFGQPGPGKVLIHGDACLPNFIYKNNTFS